MKLFGHEFGNKQPDTAPAEAPTTEVVATPTAEITPDAALAPQEAVTPVAEQAAPGLGSVAVTAETVPGPASAEPEAVAAEYRMPTEILAENQGLLTNQEPTPETATLGTDSMTDLELRNQFGLEPLPEQQPNESTTTPAGDISIEALPKEGPTSVAPEVPAERQE